MKAFPKNSYDFLVADKEVFLLDKIEKGEKIMFSLFKKEKFKIVSPLDGQLILLKDVPDSVFSQKLMGDGFAIIPQSQVVVSPISGVAESVFSTGHAVGIKTKMD